MCVSVTPREKRRQRRGMSVMQTAVVLVLIAAAVFVAARALSTSASSDLQDTAGGIADPSKLADRFAH